MSSIPWLRRQAVGWSLAADVDLAGAMTRLEFVQADPIKAPAPAQDLILRQRVPRYRLGDLHREYARLGIDEGILYAYGFVVPRLLPLIHPRQLTEGYAPSGLAADVLAFVRKHGVTHPRDLTAEFGKVAVVNGWGGQSAATTRALEELHLHGLLRVAYRENGIRLYEPAPPPAEELDPAARLRGITLRIAELLAPVPEPSLRAALPGTLSRAAGGRGAVVRDLLDAGQLTATEVDRVRYLWPATLSPVTDEPGDRVRLLAPFDPVVWDRRRFELLWGWAYRFEAYTPVAKRKLGYYALPLLWRDQVIGWANWLPDGPQVGFVDGVGPRSRRFRAALDAEVARMEAFLRPRAATGLLRPRAPGEPGQAPSGRAASSASTPA